MSTSICPRAIASPLPYAGMHRREPLAEAPVSIKLLGLRSGSGPTGAIDSMIVTTKELFRHAYGKYAVGAYNINNLEQTVGLFRGNLGKSKTNEESGQRGKQCPVHPANLPRGPLL